MARYVALLRGVNVGGVRISMDQLRRLGADAGFSEVSTHLNSGNMLFGSAGATAADLAESISAAIKLEIGRPVPVVIRTPTQLRAALDTALEHFGEADERRVAIMFLDRSAGPAPHGDQDERLGQWPAEEYRISGAEVYLHYPAGQADSKLTAALIEKRLGVVGTARGIKTVAGLIAKS